MSSHDGTENPTPTPTSPEPTGPHDHRTVGRGDGGKRRALAGAAGALLLTVGLGGVALAATSTDGDRMTSPTAGTAATDSATPRAGRAMPTIEDLSLADLADELERLGLEVRVGPQSDGPETDTRPDADADTGPDADADEGDDGDIDPFEGMTEAEIDALSDEEFLDRLEKAGIEPEWVDGDPSEDGSSGGADDHDHGDEGEPLGTASIDGDRIDTTGLSPEVATQATEIWQRFTQLIPADQRQMVAAFELLDEDYQGAHVYPDDDDPTRWTLGVGLGLGEDLDYILIHEFAHLLTLQANEVPPGDDTGSCPTYHTGEGCALRGSTVAEFVARFWPQDRRDQVNELYEAEDEEGFAAFYEEHKDEFVTDYAASNPAEDLAETFAIFVTEDRPTGDTIADQKVQMLWSDADLVELRTKIRSAL